MLVAFFVEGVYEAVVAFESLGYDCIAVKCRVMKIRFASDIHSRGAFSKGGG